MTAAMKPISSALSGRKVHTRNYCLAQQRWNEHSIIVPADHPYDQVFDESYYANIAERLRPGEIIHVRAEDGSWYARLMVRSAGRLWAKVSEIEHVDFREVVAIGASDEFAGYEVKFSGFSDKWRVVRLKDKKALKAGCQTEDEARTWLRDHLKALSK